MEFDKSKILTVVTADQAKVGQKGWFASNVETLSRLVLEEQPKELLGFDSNNAVHAFKTAFQNHALFYPAPEPSFKVGDRVIVEKGVLSIKEEVATVTDACDKETYMYIDFGNIRTGIKKRLCRLAPEPTYAERQAQWLKDNNLKVGDFVKVVREFSAKDMGDGVGTGTEDEFKRKLVLGKVFLITQVMNSCLYLDGHSVPYTACEPAKPTYRPFANAEEFKPFRDEWFVSKCDNSKSSSVNVQNYSNLGVILLREVPKNDDVVFDLCKWDEFFKWFTRENGEPCGVREDRR